MHLRCQKESGLQARASRFTQRARIDAAGPRDLAGLCDRALLPICAWLGRADLVASTPKVSAHPGGR